MKGLTEKQQNILDFIDDFHATEDMAPTIYEIASYFGIQPATAFSHIRALQKKGYLSRSSKARSLTVTGSTSSSRNLSLALSIPMLGHISAGAPLLSEENVERSISLDPAAFPGMRADKPLFGLTVSGESMRDAGMLDGDTIIARQQETANVGDIVVALTESGETTVKYFFIDQGKIELRPGNEEYPSRYFDAHEIYIQGVVVALQRTI